MATTAHPQLPVKTRKPSLTHSLFLEIVVHQLQEVVIAAKRLEVPRSALASAAS